MKTPYIIFVAAAVFPVLVSSSGAADYQSVTVKEGIEVMILYNPLGPNNQIVANIKFINHNDYKAEVSWMPLISCGEGNNHKGYGASFSIGAGQSYVVPLWRSGACAQGKIASFDVEMEVKEAGP